jgi:hypothetical protein
MTEVSTGRTIRDGKDAVAFMLGHQIGDIEGYVVIGILADGSALVASNACCNGTKVAALCQAAAQIAANECEDDGEEFGT